MCPRRKSRNGNTRMGLKTAMIPKNKPNAGSDDAAGLRESDGEPGFLRRWSRRKAQARQVPKPQPSTPPNEPTPEAVSAEAAPVIKQDATDSDLPPIDQLDENSDYSAFMSPKVSEHLRRTALRKLFHTPQFNVIDPVDQFALDWNGFTPLGAIATQDRRAPQSDVGSADILSYNNANTVTGAATPERMALRKLFYTPQFNVIDPVDQFALDWNGFTPLGAIVTQDRRAAQSEGPANTGAGADKHTASN